MNSSRVGLPSLLFLVFVVLKLTGYITWSWWYVTAPLWGGFLAALALFLVAFAIGIALEIRKTSKSKS